MVERYYKKKTESCFLKDIDIFFYSPYNNISSKQQGVFVQAWRQEGVPERIVLWSFQEGLCSDTSNRSRLI